MCVVTGDADHLADALSARILSCKVTVFPFVITQYFEENNVTRILT